MQDEKYYFHVEGSMRGEIEMDIKMGMGAGGQTGAGTR